MKKLLLLLIIIAFSFSGVQAQKQKNMEKEADKLCVLWTSGDPDVAEKVCFMYTYNAKKQGWFNEVALVIWGPSSKLLSENESLQEYVKKMQDAGVIVEACSACANMYGVVDDLRELGIEVKGMGVPLTNYIKGGWKTLTF